MNGKGIIIKKKSSNDASGLWYDRFQSETSEVIIWQVAIDIQITYASRVETMAAHFHNKLGSTTGQQRQGPGQQDVLRPKDFHSTGKLKNHTSA
jgi:hypothetical protein